jgi:hypothetical protein
MNPGRISPEFFLEAFSKKGFMYNCRHLNFDQRLGEEFIRAILGIDVPSLTEADRRNFALKIFDLPFLLAVWRDMCVQNGADAREYSRVMRELHQAVYDKMNELLMGAETP